MAVKAGEFRQRWVGAVAVTGVVLTLALAGCAAKPQLHGYQISNDTLEQIKTGTSQEAVLLLLGSPSTTSTVGGKAFYYISNTTLDDPIFGTKVLDQHVAAIYFDDKGKVKEVANYGLQDGKIFDFIQRRTRTGGEDVSLLGQMLEGLGRGSLPGVK